MDQRTIGIYLSRILSGFFVFFHKGQKYKLIYPDISIKYEAELYAAEIYDDNKFNDWIMEEDIVHLLITMGMWSHNGDTNLKNLEKQIEDLKVDLYNNSLNPNKIKSLRRTLQNTKNTYNKQYSIRHSLDQYTAQGYSDYLKNHYILVHSIYNNKNEKIFTDINSIDYSYFEKLSDIINENTIDVTTYKTIARNDLWKSYWSANSENIFDKSVVNWTDEQKTLVVLSKMYDNAYQHPEAPPDNIFEDDDMFDGWMIFQRRQNEKNKNKQRTEKMLEGKKLNKAGEIFLVANSQEEANNIYSLNENTERHIIQERSSFINRAQKPIDSTKLPDVQRDLITQINQKNKR
jgi:hypothetical protein